MNQKLAEFIRKLNNQELAFFYKFRYDSFMSPSKNLILNELNKRKLTDKEIETLTGTKTTSFKNELCCPICGSNKIDTILEKELKIFFGFSYEKEKRKFQCKICNSKF